MVCIKMALSNKEVLERAFPEPNCCVHQRRFGKVACIR